MPYPSGESVNEGDDVLRKRRALLARVAACPSCRGRIGIGREMYCGRCHTRYGCVREIPALCEEALLKRMDEQNSGDSENRFKNAFKRWPNFYVFCVRVITPVLFSGLTVKRFLRRYADQRDLLMLNVGSGPARYHPMVLNIDVFPFRDVDMLADACALPFADGTFDVVCSEQVIEHVPDAKRMARELVRVAKPGGLIYLAAPFVYPLHPSPKDYSRWTVDGYHALLKPAEPVEQGVLAGPTSGFLSITANWLAIVCSFGLTPLRKVLHYAFMIILSPVKLLDYLYANLPGAEEVAKAMYVVVRKPVGTPESCNTPVTDDRAGSAV